MRQFVPHDSDSPRCSCWSCCNIRLVAENRDRRAKQREMARQLTQNLVMSIVSVELGKPTVYRLERADRWTMGTLAELMLMDQRRDDFTVVEGFIKLESAVRFDLLTQVHRRKSVAVCTMWPSWDEEWKEHK